MKEITADTNLIANCGLYCGACRSYLKESCPGCAKNEKAKWCKIRTCCSGNKLLSCAECKTVSSPEACGMLNNFISKMFGLLFNSNRVACINMLRQKGPDAYAHDMASSKRMTLPRK